MGAKDDDAAKRAREDRREAERQVRLKTGRPAASVAPSAIRQIRRRAKGN